MTIAEVKNLVLSNSNFDTKYLKNHILSSQRRYLRDFLGEQYYDELTSQVAGSSLTADNSTVLEDYVKPCLAYYVVYEALPNVRNQITKGGIMNNISDTSEQSSFADFSHMRNDILGKADYLKEEISRYIKDEQKDDTSKYPLFDKSQDAGQNSSQIIIY